METAPQHIVTLQPAPDAATLAPSSNDGPRRPRRSVKPVSRLDDIQTAPTVAAARRAPPRSSGSTRRAAPAPSTQKYPRTGRRGAPQVFPRKLYEILTNERSDVIGWTSSGKSFIILEMEIFVNEILMNYFRHQKYSSFQRQLNLYGFRKIQKGPDTGAYAHEHFLRDQPESLTFVRRMPQSQNGMTSSSSSSSLSSLDKAASAGTVGGGGGASAAAKRTCPAARNVVSRLSDCFDKPRLADDSGSEGGFDKFDDDHQHQGNGISAESEYHDLMTAAIVVSNGVDEKDSLDVPIAHAVTVSSSIGHAVVAEASRWGVDAKPLAATPEGSTITITQQPGAGVDPLFAGLFSDGLSEGTLEGLDPNEVIREGAPATQGAEMWLDDFALESLARDKPALPPAAAVRSALAMPRLGRLASSDSTIGFSGDVEELMERIDNLDMRKGNQSPVASAPARTTSSSSAVPHPGVVYGEFEVSPELAMPMRSVSMSSDTWMGLSTDEFADSSELDALFVQSFLAAPVGMLPARNQAMAR
mmetsp:Transcript_96438/g.274945  ORF Transcript_96438/g.274945 Transcript_96438/m.274945 type:complete len:530 (+) Transcript_96438:90-1679(+)|eukprot:CAMPEP_0119475086 /NCGR_PEP_ID=MMETSP1344-20130328/6107_1 /TAXON_ID=236787 /ORGANISM="Florenciella parvula, Strain CCMP2471" /LENGTH=529 /DNA_ID=CAMNT_0007508533 /DNA_START=308 /DNA_END=1897 /DNA_ORIENTATION=+